MKSTLNSRGITRTQCVCVRCGQPQGAKHLPACPLKRFTAGTGGKGTAA